MSERLNRAHCVEAESVHGGGDDDGVFDACVLIEHIDVSAVEKM